MSKCVEIGERELKDIFPRKIFLAQGLQSIVACQKFILLLLLYTYLLLLLYKLYRDCFHWKYFLRPYVKAYCIRCKSSNG